MGKLAHNAEEIAQCNIHLRNNGMSLRVYQLGSAGEAPTVLLLHGFPECWYSWRFQMDDLHKAGFHVVALDMRGYGRSDVPESVDQYTSFHIVGDIIGLLDALSVKQAFVIGHDWGSIIGWDLCLFRPDRVKAYVAVSVPFIPRHPDGSLLKSCTEEFGEGFYMARFQEPGKIEAHFASVGTSETLKTMLTQRPKNLRTGEMMGPEHDGMPPWFTVEDLKYYTELFELSGFTGPVNYYRNMEKTWELKAPWTHVKVQTPALFIAGDKDLVADFPGMDECIKGGGLKAMLPNLHDMVILEGGHFIHQEASEKFNEVVIKYLKSQT